jgi:internalin A
MNNAMLKTLFSFCGVVLLGLQLNAQIITTVAGGATGHGGYWGDGGPATDAEIGYFGCVAVDGNRNVYIADGNNNRIRKVDALSGIITTVAGTGIAGYNGDGIIATTAQLNYPSYVTVDPAGNLFIQDPNNNRIRKVDIATGIITTFAGNGSPGFGGDNGPATAAQVMASAIAWDIYGNFYIADAGNRRIRKVNPLGIITTIAGNGVWYYRGWGACYSGYY